MHLVVHVVNACEAVPQAFNRAASSRSRHLSNFFNNFRSLRGLAGRMLERAASHCASFIRFRTFGSTTKLHLAHGSLLQNLNWRMNSRTMATQSPVPLSATPLAGQLVEHQGNTYETIQEGQAFILIPPNTRKSQDPQSKGKTGKWNCSKVDDSTLTVSLT